MAWFFVGNLIKHHKLVCINYTLGGCLARPLGMNAEHWMLLQLSVYAHGLFCWKRKMAYFCLLTQSFVRKLVHPWFVYSSYRRVPVVSPHHLLVSFSMVQLFLNDCGNNIAHHGNPVAHKAASTKGCVFAKVIWHVWLLASTPHLCCSIHHRKP